MHSLPFVKRFKVARAHNLCAMCLSKQIGWREEIENEQSFQGFAIAIVRNALIGMIQKEYAFPVTSSKL
jgi:hypothetical protein